MVDIDFLHGGNIYEIKRRYKKEVIDFSANVNPLGLTKAVKRELSKCYRLIPHYPDPEAKDLIGQIAEYWAIEEQNILIGNGSIEIIYLIAHAFKPEKTLIPAPTFSEYERAVKSVGSKIEFLKLREMDSFTLNITNSDKADISFISNPNNPTGNLLVENKKLVLNSKLNVIDEAFMDFLPDERKRTFIWEAVKDKRFIVLRSFTKFFALPGLRIGYLVAHKDLIKRLKQIQPPWSVNSIAQHLARILLNDRDHIEKTRRLINEEREFLFNKLAALKRLKPYPSVANFFLVNIIDSRLDSSILTGRLIQEGILIRDCSNFRGLDGKHFRVAVRSHRENIKLINALREILCRS
ncbi:MAG: threonine-phosphate decarboxylase CobD [Thermodesulfovibrionales bacterium]|nr:threonine-phosphate decarboxylase CobD [Thermodesulfovibrionales bacterium]